jgi:hypothetical protein
MLLHIMPSNTQKHDISNTKYDKMLIKTAISISQKEKR